MSPLDALDAASIARLADELADRIADRIAERFPALRVTADLFTAAEVADEYRVSVSWVYAHQQDLGAERLGSGTKPRLRFRRERIEAYLHGQIEHLLEVNRRAPSTRWAATQAVSPRRPVQLLPIKDRAQ